MLEFNGKQYAATKAEFESINAHGYYRVNRGRGRVSILFMTSDTEPIALISPDGATVTATRAASGVFYMFGCTKETEIFLGITDLKYSALCDMGRAAINTVKQAEVKA